MSRVEKGHCWTWQFKEWTFAESVKTFRIQEELLNKKQVQLDAVKNSVEDKLTS